MARDLATQINRFIAKSEPGAPLAGQGAMLVRVGQKYGVDPRVLAIIARKESQFGKTSGKFRNNAWGWGVHLGPDVYTSPTWEAGAEKVAKGLTSGLYKGAGKNTLGEIISTYAPPSENDTGTYIRQISDWYRQMGGNPNSNVFKPGAWGAAGGTAGTPTRPGRRGSDPVETQYEASTRMVPGQIDTKRLMMLLNNQKGRSLRGIMPAEGFMRELGKLTQGAMPRAETVLTVRRAGAAASAAGATGAPALPASGQGERNDRVVSAARQHLGVPYSWGGGSPSGPSRGSGRGANTVGFDCSSLVQYAWAKVGVKIPRVTYDQAKVGRSVPVKNRGAWQPGDLLFSRPGSRGPEHVRMYIGGGKAIQAPQTGGHVEIINVPDDVYIVRRPG